VNLKPLYQARQTVKLQQNPSKNSTLKPATINLEILKFRGEKWKKKPTAEPVKNMNTDQKYTPHGDVNIRVKLIGRSKKRQKTKTSLETKTKKKKQLREGY